MNWAVLALALSLTSVCGERPPLDDWPPDVGWCVIREHEAESRGQEEADRAYQWRLTSEHAYLLGSDVVVVGTVKSVRDSLVSQGGETRVMRSHAITVTIEECVKGDCQGGEIKAYMIRRFGREGPPPVGGRYVFFMRQYPTLKGVHFGGSWERRLLIEDGVVMRKGIGLDAFLSIARRHLASRAPEPLSRTSDAVVLGTVVEKETSIRFEGDPLFPGDHNFVRLSLEEVAKGPFAVGDTIEVRLGYHSIPQYGLYEAIDSPRLLLGERVVLFLCHGETGEWSPAAGADSRLPVRLDGSFLRWDSLSDLGDETAD